jgi:hypothetical protein
MNRSTLLLVVLAAAAILIIQGGTILGSRAEYEPVLDTMAESFEITN